MSHHAVENIRNIAVCGHGAAGKSTLIEQMLLRAGAVKQARRQRGRGRRLRRPRKVASSFDRKPRHALRARRQVLSDHRHAGLSRLHRPNDRRPARRRHGGDRHQRPLGHRSEHAPHVSRSRQARARADDRHQQDGRRQHRLSRRCSQRIQETFGHECLLLERAGRLGRELQGRRQSCCKPIDGASRARSSIRPSTATKLIESIIELDDEVTVALLRRQAADAKKNCRG